MFKDNKLRLLMSLVGFERIGIDDEPDSTWTIPSAVASRDLQETLGILERHRDNPIMEYGDEEPLTAEEMLRRKPIITPRADYDDDSEDDSIVMNGEEDFLFPAGGPTDRKSDALEELKKNRRKRKRLNPDEPIEIDEETRRARRNARDEATLDKMRKIKSELYVHDSDDEEDEERDLEFFAREEQRRKGQSLKVLQALRTGDVSGVAEDHGTPDKRKKRKTHSSEILKQKQNKLTQQVSEDGDSASNDSDNDEEMHITSGTSSPNQKAFETSEDEASETPLSSQPTHSSQELKRQEYPDEVVSQTQPSSPSRVLVRDKVNALQLDVSEEDEDDDAPVVHRPGRRVRVGLLADSDEDE